MIAASNSNIVLPENSFVRSPTQTGRTSGNRGKRVISIRWASCFCFTAVILVGCGSPKDSDKYDYKLVSYEPKISADTKSFLINDLKIPTPLGKESAILIPEPVNSREPLVFRGQGKWPIAARGEKQASTFSVTIFRLDRRGNRVVHARDFHTLKRTKADFEFQIATKAPFQRGIYQIEIACDQMLLAKGQIQTNAPVSAPM